MARTNDVPVIMLDEGECGAWAVSQVVRRLQEYCGRGLSVRPVFG